MVRAFVPQAYPGHIVTNTNTPPQNSGLGGGGPPVTSDELHEESAGVFGNLIYDDGVESGNVIINEGPPPNFELVEETSGVFDNLIYDDGVNTGQVIVRES